MGLIPCARCGLGVDMENDCGWAWVKLAGMALMESKLVSTAAGMGVVVVADVKGAMGVLGMA